MSPIDLLKGRTQKYIKRIPKAGGGYRYVYKEHHKGGVGAVEHMKEGAAFKLTFGGQEGHFHIIAAEGDKITVKHDELHGPDHKGVEMTKAELSELLTREHKPALEADAKKKRERVERMKRETPRHIGLKQAERLAKEAEARLGEERPDNFETMPESEGESPTSPAQSVEDIDAQLEANEPKLSELSDLRFRLKQARKAPPPKADKRAKPPEDLFSGLGASREAAVKQGFKLRKPTEAEARLIEEQQAIFDAPADAKPKPSPELVAIREQYQEAFPEGALKPFKELFMAGVMLEPYTLRHTQASRTDIDTTKLTEWFIKEHDYKKRKAMREAAEIVRVYVDEARKVELYAANALEHSTTDEQRAEINELVQQARQKVAQYIDDLHAGKDLSSRRRSDRQVSDNIRTDLNITRALRELRNKHLEQSLKEAQRQERAILDQNAELRDRKDEIEKQARQPAPDNFETMPEGESESPTSPAQSAEDIDAQLEANELKLIDLDNQLKSLKTAKVYSRPPKEGARANPSTFIEEMRGPKAPKETTQLAIKQGFKLRVPTETEARLIEEQQAIFDAPTDAKPKPSPELAAIRDQYREAFPEGPKKPFKELFMAGAMLEPYTLEHTQATRADIDAEKLTEWLSRWEGRSAKRARKEAAEIRALYIDQMRKIELYAADALKHSTTDEQRAEINQTIQEARTKARNYIERLTSGREEGKRNNADNVQAFLKVDLNITRALRVLKNKQLKQSIKQAEDKRRAILDQNAELRDRKDELETQARQPAPDNFETMPESDDYTRQGVALSPKGRVELARATGAAMRAGDRDKVRELTERADRDNVHTGDEKIDALFNFMFVEGTRKDLPDGGRTVEHSGRLSGMDAKALEDAAKRGVLNVQTTPNGAKVYSLSGELAARSLDSNMTLVTNKGAYTFNYADFSAPNAHEGYPPEQLAEDLIKESDELPPPKDPAKANAILDELKSLINENPALAKDPRIAALLGTPEGKEPPKREGREATLFVTGIAGLDPNQKARYKLIEAGDAIASHDPIAFSKRRDYPEGVQERAYHSAKNEQLKVIANAGAKFNPAYLVNTNPDATNGPPILTPEGHALGGNSRVMSLQRVYNQNPEGAKRYKEELKAQAASFGFSAEDIDALEAPMLVRVYDPQEDSTEELRKLVRAMNESKTAGMEGRTEGRALASKLSDNTLKTIKRVLDKAPKDYSLNRFLTKPSKGLDELVGALFRDGIITPESAPKLLRVSDGTLNPQGRDMIQKILVGHVVRDDRILAALDYQTFENLTVVLGKLAAAGLNETQRSALEDAVALYNYATQKDTLKARDSLKERDDAMRFILEEEQELFSGASAEGLDMEGLKSRTLANPLARGFLQIMVLAPSSKKLENAFDSFIELTEKKEQIDMFAAGPMEYEAAINQLIKELGEKEKLDVRPYGQTKKSIDLETALFKHLLRKARARALS